MMTAAKADFFKHETLLPRCRRQVQLHLNNSLANVTQIFAFVKRGLFTIVQEQFFGILISTSWMRVPIRNELEKSKIESNLLDMKNNFAEN